MGNHLQMRTVPLPCLITGGYIYFHPGQLTFPGKLRTKTEHIPIRRPLQLNESHVFPMFFPAPPKKRHHQSSASSENPISQLYSMANLGISQSCLVTPEGIHTIILHIQQYPTIIYVHSYIQPIVV